jgi:UPF0148 protein
MMKGDRVPDTTPGGGSMKREDDIMAGYLLKGGKMLSKSCPSCGCPLFEVKGETFCVVCREEETARGKISGSATPQRPDIPEKTARAGQSSPDLASSLEATLIAVCLRMREEKDPGQVLVLANAVKSGIEALRLLR